MARKVKLTNNTFNGEVATDFVAGVRSATIKFVFNRQKYKKKYTIPKDITPEEALQLLGADIAKCIYTDIMNKLYEELKLKAMPKIEKAEDCDSVEDTPSAKTTTGVDSSVRV